MIVEVEGLVKDFGNVRAVDNVSFSIEEGEIFSLLGPNGAGKTTTVMILATLLKPTAGKAKIAGYDVLKEAAKVRKNIGIVFQETTLDLELTAKENLDLHARLYGMGKKERERRIKELLELVDLSDKANVQVKKFSGGMKRKLEIARGLMHFPKLLFLDEPTLGLDAHTRRKIWDYVVQAKEETSIILTTHYIEEAERLCNRVAIMNKGKIVALDKPEKLIDKAGSVVVIEAENVEKIAEHLNEKYVISNGSLRVFTKRGEELLPELISRASAKGIEVKAARIEKQSLEDIFIQITR